MEWTVSSLLQIDAVLLRLESIITDLPEEKIELLVSGKGAYLDRLFFEKFGFTKNGVIFNSLLAEYLRLKGYGVPVVDVLTGLTGKESDVYTFLHKNSGRVVKRNELALVLWGDKWEGKYSDDAIDQIIHRLREKLKAVEAPFVLTTRKGLGVILNPTA